MSNASNISTPLSFDDEGSNEQKQKPLSFDDEGSNEQKQKPLSFDDEGSNEQKQKPLSFDDEGNNEQKQKPLSFDDEGSNEQKQKPLSFDDEGMKNKILSSKMDSDKLQPNIPLVKGTKSDIINANSNFVFFFGLPQTGKTVILSALLYYLRTSVGALEPKMGTENERDAKVLLHDITEKIKKGVMPERTPTTQLTRLDFEFRPNNKSKKVIPIDLTFLEISGEKYLDISQEEGFRNEFDKNIAVFFRPDIKLNIIIVTSFDTAERDDTVIKEFFDELKNRGINLQSINAVLVISKWDKSKTIGLKRKVLKKHLADFIKNKLPMASTHLDTYGVQKTYFTIGTVITKKIEVTRQGKKEEKLVDCIEEFNTASAKSLSNWLYKSIVGFPFDYPGTLLERLKFSLFR